MLNPCSTIIFINYHKLNRIFHLKNTSINLYNYITQFSAWPVSFLAAASGTATFITSSAALYHFFNCTLPVPRMLRWLLAVSSKQAPISSYIHPKSSPRILVWALLHSTQVQSQDSGIGLLHSFQVQSQDYGVGLVAFIPSSAPGFWCRPCCIHPKSSPRILV